MTAIVGTKSSPARRRSARLDYQVLFESIAEGVTLCEAVRNPAGQVVDYLFLDANRAFLCGFRVGSNIIGKRLTELRPDASPAWFKAIQDTLDTGEPGRFRYHDVTLGRWYDIHCIGVSDQRFAHFFTDITSLRAAERHKASLLDELNHRVKNNLAIIASLLSLQARQAPPEVREQLDCAVDRIHVIADLHADLYRSGDREHIDLARYLGALVERLSRSLLEDDRVRLVVEAVPLRVPLDFAVQLAIVINELVTNAVKHAYPPPARGAITIRLSACENELLLCVSDHGVGLPPVESGRRGLGMRVVTSFVQQCGGVLQIRNDAGASFEVRLPLNATDAGETAQSLLL